MRRNYLLFLFLLLAGFTSVNAQVQASFTASQQFGCPPMVVSFTDNSTGATSWHWDFDNGNVSNNQNPTASYPSPGVYNVLLTVSNGSVTDTQSMQIRVFEPPTDSFTSYNNIGCANPCHMVNFINLTVPGESPVTQYAWGFGDGSLAQTGTNVTHCYTTPGTYSVVLVAKDSNGCQVSKTMPNFVVIASPPTASMTASPAQTCSNTLNVHFTGSGSSPNGPVTYAWYFGNGNTSAQQNPSQTYSSGIYNPFLVITDSLGCQDTATTQVAVTNVIANFASSTTQACSGISIQFFDSSNYANAWLWNFGDGSTSTQQNPTHTYANNGTYTVTLTASYGNCQNTVTRTNYINVTPPINFTIGGSPTASCTAPLTVNFTNTAVGASSYAWTFGDGGTSTVSSPSHTYTTSGYYTVTLGIANAAGCVNTVTDSAYVHIGGPTATFTIDSTHGCAPVTLQFNVGSVTGGPITSYHWVFGDGGTSNATNPSYTYFNTGSFMPYLVVTNSAGCTYTVYSHDSVIVGNTLIPDFTASPLVQCVDQQISFTNNTVGTGPNTHYLWNFGDGQTSNLQNPTHVYSDTGYYNITLTVINQGCAADTERIHYILIVVPKADFNFNFSCSSPTDVTFRDTSQGADTWFWEFGDGTTSNLKDPPTHHYATQGSYTITLIVTNNTTGCVDSTKKTLPIGTPQISFASDVRSGCMPLTVHFSDSSTLATGWLWKFGDGGVSSVKNPIHTYNDTGSYAVTLIVNPGATCADTLVIPNYITVYGIKVNPVITPLTGCKPLNVSFSDQSVSYLGTVTSWRWKFGVANDTSVAQNTSFTYLNTGLYTVNLKVTDNHGCTANVNKTITVQSTTSYFTSDTIVCPGENAHFFNLSQNAGAYKWNFGDGTFSTDSTPVHAYANSGDYTVSLIAVNSTYGCRDTFVNIYQIHVDTPFIDFSAYSTFSQCPPFPAQFYNRSNRTDLTWLWSFGDGDTSSAANPLHIYLLPGYYNVTLTGTDSSGCVGSKTKINYIQVKGPIGHFNETPQVGCVPLTVVFSGTTQSTQSSIFIPGDGPSYGTVIDTQYTFTSSGEYIPTYMLTDSFGCTVAYPLHPVIVGRYPYPNLPPDTLICKGNYTQLTLPAGDSLQFKETYLWTSNLAQTYLSCDTCADPVSMSPDTITYYITSTSYYAAAGDTVQCMAKDTFLINVDALPIIFPGIDFRICPNDTLQLHAGPNVTQATWTPDLYISDTASANPKAWPPDTTTYRVTGTNDAGCSISRIVKVYPITKVVVDIATTDTSICAGSLAPIDVRVLEASFNDTSFLWSPGKYLAATNVENTTATLPPGSYTYSVIVSSRGCISDTASMHVTVSDAPDLEAGDNQTVAYGTNVQLYAASHQNVTYTWSSPIDSFSCNECRRPNITVTQSETVFVTATNEYGCKTVDSVRLKVVACDSKMIFVPNTFTPNNDGQNDKLFVRGAGLKELEYFRVFDRWGNLVFETHNISEGWDGSFAGRPSDIATYVYVLRGICSSGSVVDMSGNVTLVR